MSLIVNRYRQLYTHGGRIFDLDTIDNSLNVPDMELRYGWEACMAYGNLIHDDISSQGRGVREGDIVVDLGSNIGMSALNMERKKAAKIYCVEPDRRTYETLLLNKGTNWIVDNYAISDVEETLTIGHWPDGRTTSQVRAITLDQYFAQHNFQIVNLIKIDIEGKEKTLFDRVSQSTLDKIESMAIEYHENENLSVEDKNAERLSFVSKIALKGFFNYTVLTRKWQSMIYFWK